MHCFFIIWRKVIIYIPFATKFTDDCNPHTRRSDGSVSALCCRANEDDTLVPCQKNWAHRWHLKTPPSMEFSSHSRTLFEICSPGATWRLNGLIIWHNSCFVIHSLVNSLSGINISKVNPPVTNRTSWKLNNVTKKVSWGHSMSSSAWDEVMTFPISQEKQGADELIVTASLLFIGRLSNRSLQWQPQLILNSDES